MHVDAWAAAANLIKQKRRNGDACHRVAIEILRPWIVVPIEVKNKKRWHRPDEHRGKNRGVPFREIGTPAPRGVATRGRRFLLHIKYVRGCSTVVACAFLAHRIRGLRARRWSLR